ncbi:MAG: response regulator [Myxococcota bacterium]
MPRILVVDDDRAIQSMLTDTLEARGYIVDTARTGREAIAVFDEGIPPDLLLLDVLIPHINGFALVEQLRQRPELRELPIIMMSGIYRSRNHRSEMTGMHRVLDYLDKPFDNERLFELIEGAVGSGEEAPAIDVGELDLPESEEEPWEEPTDSQKKQGDALVEPAARVEKAEVEKDARNEFKQSAFLFQGSIRKTPLAEVIGQLWAARKSGALLLRRDRVKKILYMRDGSPYHVKSNMVSECLGRLLVAQRLITPEQCEASIREMKSAGKRQGEVLVEMNSISPKNLTYALELQMETKLFEPFAWKTGEYRFNPSAKLPELHQPIEFTGASFVVEGIRRAYDETRLRGQMLPILQVPLRWAVKRPDLDALKLTRSERSAAKRIDNGMHTEDMLEALNVHPPDALRIVYSLISLGMLEPEVE